MPRVEDILNHRQLIDYTKVRTIPPMIGETLFPTAPKLEGIEAELVKGANNTPIAASIHAFDSETEIGSLEDAKVTLQELALIKRKYKVTEKEIIALANPRNSREEAQLINKLFDHVDILTNGILARVEAMRLEALATGKLTINENGFKAIIDYGMPSANKVSKKWSDGTGSILDDIYNLSSAIKTATGFKPTRALTSTTTLNVVLKDATIRKAVFGVNSDMILSVNKLNEFLAANSMPQIAVYDELYRVQGKDGKYSTKRYLPESAFVLMPDGKLGDTFYGVTAEELELRNDPSIKLEEIGNILVEQYNTTDPVAKWIKAVATAMPSFPYADQVGVITVS